MTSQNIVFLAVLAALGVGILLRLNFILQHIPLSLGVAAVAAGALVYLTRQGLVDWDEWIPKSRD